MVTFGPTTVGVVTLAAACAVVRYVGVGTVTGFPALQRGVGVAIDDVSQHGTLRIVVQDNKLLSVKVAAAATGDYTVQLGG